jgi:hypothetical protein
MVRFCVIPVWLAQFSTLFWMAIHLSFVVVSGWGLGIIDRGGGTLTGTGAWSGGVQSARAADPSRERPLRRTLCSPGPAPAPTSVLGPAPAPTSAVVAPAPTSVVEGSVPVPLSGAPPAP